MNKQHHYSLTINWTGNTGAGTAGYKSYEREHIIRAEKKPLIPASSDPAFRGDQTRYNPEELLVASVSSCHMLWYLHLCSDAGVVVTNYEDRATGTMEETPEGGGKFTRIVLHPEVTVQKPEMIANALKLHKRANQLCFIANSVAFEIVHEPVCKAV